MPKPKTTLYLAASNSALAIPRVRAVADHLARELERAEAKTKSPRS